MDNQKKTYLQDMATKIRMGIVTEVYSANSGHPGGSLSISDVLSVLFFDEMRLDPAKPDWPERDRFVMSKGHCAPALYAALANKGFFPVDELATFRKTSGRLEGHPDMKHIPGVDMTTGSLGLGISTACGMAVSAKIFHEDYRVYAVMGDGEIEEGQVWEAAMFAAHYKLDNLCAVLDLNGLQIDGPTKEVMNSAPAADKFRSFGWNVIELDGHDLEAIETGFRQARETKGKPTLLVASTTKGKGVSYMENQVGWHGSAPNKEQYEQAMTELRALLSKEAE